MSKRSWLFLINTFEANTRGSNVKMLSLATDTRSKLQAQISDPIIANIMLQFDPVFQAYNQIYINYDIVAGVKKGKTLNLENLLKENLLDELRKWEAAVRVVYPEDSVKEVEFFPNKRSPFLRSTYEDRIATVATLQGNLASDSNFTSLANQVQSFYNLLLTARDTQQQNEGNLGLLSSIRENQRKLLATELFGVYGALINKYRATPETVGKFFDLSLLRDTNDRQILASYEGNIAASATENLGLLPTGATLLKVSVLSGGAVEFGLSLDGVNFIGNTTTIGGIGEETIVIADLNSTGTQILVRNQNALLQAGFKVEVWG